MLQIGFSLIEPGDSRKKNGIKSSTLGKYFDKCGFAEYENS